MVYRMEFNVDGGCRGGDGHPYTTTAAAAAIRWLRGGRHKTRAVVLHSAAHPATSQRAELVAVIVALQWALEIYAALDGYPRVRVRVRSDSRYAVGCMTEWVHKWSCNGWRNAAGAPVANQDLVRRALTLDHQLALLGSVTYEWVPRGENGVADGACNDALDKVEGY